MAVLRPLKALRPPPDLAAQVASVPYDVVDTAEARALAGDDRLSFLHVVRPEIDLPEGTDPYSESVYEQGRMGLERLQTEGALTADPELALYIYRQTMGEHHQVGVVGRCSVDEYDRDLILCPTSKTIRPCLLSSGLTGVLLFLTAFRAANQAWRCCRSRDQRPELSRRCCRCQLEHPRLAQR